MTGPGSLCGACKFLRRKCTSECVCAPYFSYEEATMHFGSVHKVFGAGNVSKLLMHIPVGNRNEAAVTISFEALARMNDPVFGCVAHIFALHKQIANLREEIEYLRSQMAAGFPQIYPGTQATESFSKNHHGALELQHQLDQNPKQQDLVTDTRYNATDEAHNNINQYSGEQVTAHFDDYHDTHFLDRNTELLDQEMLLHCSLLYNEDNIGGI